MKQKMSLALLAPFAALAACSQPSAEAPRAANATDETTDLGATDDNPVVVELFQSQGCSSCPPANANVNEIATEPGILALSFAVTYWDRLGWKDTFGDQAYTDRQWDYARGGGRTKVATPQVIVNGGEPIIGNKIDQLRKVIADRGPLASGPDIEVTGNAVEVAAGETETDATLWLVRYDPQSVEVPIGWGENGGRMLPHRNIVHELVDLATWSGDTVRAVLPAATRDGLSTAVILQQGKGGPIIAARKV